MRALPRFLALAFALTLNASAQAPAADLPATAPRPVQVAVKYGKPMDFKALRKEAQTCSKPRLKEMYQQVADEIMTAIAALQPCEDKETFP